MSRRSMVQRMVAGVAASTLALALSACTTLKYKAWHEDWGEPYVGTVCNFKFLGMAAMIPPLWFTAVPLLIVDLPLSLAADTLVLPADLTAERPEEAYSCRIWLH